MENEKFEQPIEGYSSQDFLSMVGDLIQTSELLAVIACYQYKMPEDHDVIQRRADLCFKLTHMLLQKAKP